MAAALAQAGRANRPRRRYQLITDYICHFSRLDHLLIDGCQRLLPRKQAEMRQVAAAGGPCLRAINDGLAARSNLFLTVMVE